MTDSELLAAQHRVILNMPCSCRGCSCSECVKEGIDDDDGPIDLEDQLERALDDAFPSKKVNEKKGVK